MFQFRTLTRAALLALALVIGIGCGRESQTVLRVVLISLDTLRLDAFTGAEGVPSAMPRLRARAERGARLSRFYAATSITQPTHATMFTALHPWEHGVTSNGEILDAELVTVAEAMREAGFETGAVVAAFPLAARFGFAQGFDEYREVFTTSFLGMRRWEGREVPDRAFFGVAESVTDHALELLDGARAAKQFFWFHYFDPHAPYGSSSGGTATRWDVFRRIDAGEAESDVLDLESPGIEVEDPSIEALRCEVAGHRSAHVAEPDVSDARRHC